MQYLLARQHRYPHPTFHPSTHSLFHIWPPLIEIIKSPSTYTHNILPQRREREQMTSALATERPAQRFARVGVLVNKCLKLVLPLGDLEAFFGADGGVVHRCAYPASAVQAVAAGVVEWSGGGSGQGVLDGLAEAGTCTWFVGGRHGSGYMYIL